MTCIVWRVQFRLLQRWSKPVIKLMDLLYLLNAYGQIGWNGCIHLREYRITAIQTRLNEVELPLIDQTFTERKTDKEKWNCIEQQLSRTERWVVTVDYRQHIHSMLAKRHSVQRIPPPRNTEKGGLSLTNGICVAHLYPVYTIQPAVNTVVQPGWQQPVVQPVVGFTMTIVRVQPVDQPVQCLYTRYNRLSNRLFNQFDKRLYRINGVIQLEKWKWKWKRKQRCISNRYILLIDW